MYIFKLVSKNVNSHGNCFSVFVSHNVSFLLRGQFPVNLKNGTQIVVTDTNACLVHKLKGPVQEVVK